jgi:hypothetical protein
MIRNTRLGLAAAIALMVWLPQTSQARQAAPETWQFEMVQTWRTDRPGAKEHRRVARLWVKGNKMRREEGTMLSLISSGWKYDLQKDKKRGIKQRATRQSLQALNLTSPAQMGQMARQRGRKVGAEMIGGRKMTVYQTAASVRVWVDPEGLVFKTAGRSPNGGTFAVEMHNLRRGVPLPDKLFQPPPGYKIDEVTTPPLSALKPPGR